MFDPRPLCCSSLTTAVGGTTDTNFVDSAHPTVARIREGVYEGPDTSSLNGLYYFPLNNITDVKFDTLYDRIEQDRFVSCDSG